MQKNIRLTERAQAKRNHFILSPLVGFSCCSQQRRYLHSAPRQTPLHHRKYSLIIQATARNLSKMEKENTPMFFSLEHITYVTASQPFNGKTNRQIVAESRPEYAIIQVKGTKIQQP
jgi:hypothetical protein